MGVLAVSGNVEHLVKVMLQQKEHSFFYGGKLKLYTPSMCCGDPMEMVSAVE